MQTWHSQCVRAVQPHAHTLHVQKWQQSLPSGVEISPLKLGKGHSRLTKSRHLIEWSHGTQQRSVSSFVRLQLFWWLSAREGLDPAKLLKNVLQTDLYLQNRTGTFFDWFIILLQNRTSPHPFKVAFYLSSEKYLQFLKFLNFDSL